jgi:predicted outer membrane protein
MRLMFLFALLPLGCAAPTNGPAVSRDTARQLGGDRRYAHASDGSIILGPTQVGQLVHGQRGAGGNLHVATDRWFLQEALDLSRRQLSLARLARARAASPEVLQLAGRLEQQNQRLDALLRSLASQRRVTLEPAPPGGDQPLASLSGETFERAYVAEAEALDRRQLDLWSDATQIYSDRQLQQFAAETLPALQATHRQAAATRVTM